MITGSSTTLTPTATLHYPWYQHPLQLRCLCGVNLYGKRQRTTEALFTKFICEAPKCNQVIIYEDRANGQ